MQILNPVGLQTKFKTLKSRCASEQGFTLVELMVVVAVIAILAAIAMPQFMSAADKAKDAKTKADIQTVTNAAQLYLIDKGDAIIPTVEQLYKEGYLAEKIKSSNNKEYVITYDTKDGSTVKKVTVKEAE